MSRDIEITITQPNPFDFGLEQNSTIKDLEVGIITGAAGMLQVYHSTEFEGNGHHDNPLKLSTEFLENLDERFNAKQDNLTAGDGIIIDEDSTISTKVATPEILGAVKIGNNVNVEEDGTISVNDATNAQTGVIRIATDEEYTTNSEDIAVNPKQLNAAITTAQIGALIYKGTWDCSNPEGYASIVLPVKRGWLYCVTGAKTTVDGVEWKAGDYLVFNKDLAAGSTITSDDVDKIDNTEADDIVRLDAVQTLTNKTIDADNNIISNLETDNFKTGVIVTEIGSTGSDTTLPTEQAVRSAITVLDDKTQDRVINAIENNIATWDANGSTKDSGKSFTTTVADSTTASDNKISTEKAVRTELDTKVDKNNDITAATHTKITYDSKGLVTGGADIIAADITDLTATASEINQLHNSSVTTSDLTKLHDITATSAELNTLDGITSTTEELNQLHGSGVITADLTKLHNVTATANELNTLDGIASTTEELNQLHNSSVTTSDLTKLHNVTADANELNILDGATLDVNELNVLDGITASTTELNYVDGVTSNIQMQLDSKAADNSVVHLTGNETVTGYKTFSDPTTMKYLTLGPENTSSTSLEGGEISFVSGAGEPNAGKQVKIDRYNGSIRIFGTDSNNNTKTVLQANIEYGTLKGVTPTEDTTTSTQVDTVGARNTKLQNYQPTITGAATTITNDNLSTERALISDSNGKVAVSDVTSTELSYLDGVTSSVQTQLNNKVDKTTDVKKVYATDASGNQTTISYVSDTNTASTIVQRDANSQVNVAQTPTSDTHATSKKYVDDKVNTALTEAVVFKGIVANETLLPTTGNSNGDMYWITAYSNNPPAGMTAGVSGSAIYRKPTGEPGEWNYTEDAIYQPDNHTIELDANGQLSVMVSTVANNSVTTQSDGLYVDITGKVDKTNTASKIYGTDTNGNQTTYTLDGTSSTSSSIPYRVGGQVRVNATPSGDNDATSKKYVDAALDTKVDKNNSITAATHTKITYDAKGLVTGGTDLQESDIPSLHLAKITDVTATAAEVNVLDGITASTAELNILDGVTADANELNILDGATLTTTELNYVDGVTSSIQTQLDNKVAKNNAITGATKCKITYDSKGLVTAGADLAASDIPNLSLSKISDVTATAAEVNVLDGITASTAELNILDGITASTTELNYVDGVTSNIQTQLDSKAADNSVVHLTGNETISGVKTFNDVIGAPYLRVGPPSTSSTSLEGGEIVFKGGAAEPNADKSISIDRYNGSIRIFGADSQGTTKNLLIASIENGTLKGVTPTEDTTSSIQLDTVGARNTKLQNYAPNKDLSTLSSVGQNIANWSTNVTNCLVEVPQDIVITLSDDKKTAYVEANSVMYYPDGFEQDGTTRKFSKIILNYRRSIVTAPLSSGSLPAYLPIVFRYNQNSGNGSFWANVIADKCVSGDTTPGVGYEWYDTSTNYSGYTTGSGAIAVNDRSTFPLGILYKDSEGILTIKQVFNGLGYIGSTVFALPGVKGLIPNGRNTDGTLKNTLATNSSVHTYTATSALDAVIGMNASGEINCYSHLVYNKDTNQNYYNGSPYGRVNAGNVTFGTVGKITNFEPKTAFHGVDYNDISKVGFSNNYNDLDNLPTIGNATLTLQLNGTSVDTFTANATTNKTINFSGVQPTLESGTNIKTINNESILGSGNLTIGGVLPTQTGNAGKYLTTDGTDPSWVEIEEYTAAEVDSLWDSVITA